MLNLERHIKNNFGFQESEEIINIFEKYKLFSEIEYMMNEVIEGEGDQLQDSISDLEGDIEDLREERDELKEEKEGLESLMRDAKGKINKVLELLVSEGEVSSFIPLLEDCLTDLDV